MFVLLQGLLFSSDSSDSVNTFVLFDSKYHLGNDSTLVSVRSSKYQLYICACMSVGQ